MLTVGGNSGRMNGEKVLSKELINSPLLSVAVNIGSLPLLPLLWMLKTFLRTKLVRVRSSRIGPMAGVDVFLRRQALQGKGKNIRYLGIAATDVANQQFMLMIRRILPVLHIPQPPPVQIVLQALATRSLLARTSLFEELKFWANEFTELNRSRTLLHFTDEEEQQGKELLTTMGVNNWFVCFHARDSAYLDYKLGKRDKRHDFRNCGVENYLPAAAFIARQGGYVLRMGAKVQSKLPQTTSRIIDYAIQHRTDFGDIYLPAKCFFYLGNTSGLNSVPYVFGIPVANANVIPITRGPPPGAKDLFIPKKIWSVKEKRFLTFREMVNSEEIEYWQKHGFREDAGLIPVENSPEEILDLAQEMYQRLQGKWKPVPEDEELQQKFKCLFTPQHQYYGFPSRMGAKFLRENKQLLE